ncbi:MAG: hypothetical protein CMF96_07980 [Candidatus Marinimicrobia bacterium]|nr:hypothetical protein [Candidatus Neomarinimicrobiota bacterium]|tara:strand:- start:14428 stop:15213 length:786 start_codon:yes stop_codon:yes gene_type:complete
MISKLAMSIFFNTAWAYPLFLWNTPLKEIKNGFYRFTLGLSTILWGMACVLLFFNLSLENINQQILLAILSLLIIGSFTAYIWKKEHISLIFITTICGILAFVSYFIHKSILVNSDYLNPAFFIGVFILSNVLFAMILGHWFLNVQNLKIIRLQNIVSILGLSIIIRIVWNFYSIYKKNDLIREGEFISGYEFLVSIDGIFLWIAILFGLFIPLILNFMTSRTLKIFSTQAATGLLYINLVLILMSEMIFKYYLIQYKWVL